MVIGPNTASPAKPEWVIGLDIGQRRDYSAITVLDWLDQVTGTRDPVTFDFIRHTTIRLRHAERVPLGTPFASVVDRIGEIVSHPKLRDSTLVVDATGVGAPVVELIRTAHLPCRLIPVQITGGSDESSDGVYHRVPKRDLVTGLQVLFDHWKPQLHTQAPATKDLIRELAEFKARPSSNGGMRFEGVRDDLAMSLALAWWWMRKRVAWRPPAPSRKPAIMENLHRADNSFPRKASHV